MERALKKRIILAGNGRCVINYKDEWYYIKNNEVQSRYSLEAKAYIAQYNDELMDAIRELKSDPGQLLDTIDLNNWRKKTPPND